MDIEAAKLSALAWPFFAPSPVPVSALGIMFGHYMEGAMRNPEAQAKLRVQPMVAFRADSKPPV